MSFQYKISKFSLSKLVVLRKLSTVCLKNTHPFTSYANYVMMPYLQHFPCQFIPVIGILSILALYPTMLDGHFAPLDYFTRYNTVFKQSRIHCSTFCKHVVCLNVARLRTCVVYKIKSQLN